MDFWADVSLWDQVALYSSPVRARRSLQEQPQGSSTAQPDACQLAAGTLYCGRSGGSEPALLRAGRDASGPCRASSACAVERCRRCLCGACAIGGSRVGRARGGLRAGRANGAAGLAATLRPDSTDSGRATGRARRPAQARSQRASEAAPRGKSQGGGPSVCARGSVHLLCAARAARPRRPRRPQRARACAVPSRCPWPILRLRLRRPSLGSRCDPQPVSRGLRSAPGWRWGLVLGTQPTGFRAEGPGAALAICFPRVPGEAEVASPSWFSVLMSPEGTALLGGPEDTARRAELRAADPGPPADSASARALAPTLALLFWEVSPKQAECPFFSLRPG